jgi:hypothetical protein
VVPRETLRVACGLQSHRSPSDVTLAGSGVVSMLGRFEPTQAGFILEGEVRETATGGPCSVSGAELDAEWQPAARSLLEALRQFQGRKVRITLEVMEPQPIDTLRELLEQFRLESEAPPDDFFMVG